jgi:hypothetical protein
MLLKSDKMSNDNRKDIARITFGGGNAPKKALRLSNSLKHGLSHYNSIGVHIQGDTSSGTVTISCNEGFSIRHALIDEVVTKAGGPQYHAKVEFLDGTKSPDEFENPTLVDGNVDSHQYQNLLTEYMSAMRMNDELMESNNTLSIRLSKMKQIKEQMIEDNTQKKQECREMEQEHAKDHQALKEAMEQIEVLQRRAISGDIAGIDKINALYVINLAEVDLPVVDEAIEKYDFAMELAMEEFQMNDAEIAEALSFASSDIQNSSEYRSAKQEYEQMKSELEQFQKLAGKAKYVTINLDEIEQKVERFEELEARMTKKREIAEKLKKEGGNFDIKYLMTTSTDDSNYIISLTMPVKYKESGKDLRGLEVDLLGHVHNKWSALRSKIGGTFEKVNNRGLTQYNFVIPKSKLKDPADFLKRKYELLNAILKSQREYVFNNMGVKIYITDESTFPFQGYTGPFGSEEVPEKEHIPAAVTVPDTITEKSVSAPKQDWRSLKKSNISEATQLKYTQLAERVRTELGLQISDNPNEFVSWAKSEESYLRVPATLLAIGKGAKRSVILTHLEDDFSELGTYNRSKMTAADQALIKLKNSGVLDFDSTSKTYIINQNYGRSGD